MPRSRDRHDRGLRGPMALPNQYTGRPVPLPHRSGRSEFFMTCLADAVAQVQRTCPDALQGIDIGTEEVPDSVVLWREDRVPLAAAVEAAAGEPARIVVFQRPMEHRAATRAGLRILVHRTLVEQLSALTGRSVDDIDPGADLDEP